MRVLLFCSRLFLYLLAIFMPLFHPAIAVPYDRIGIWFWFVLIPGEMLIAFFLPRVKPKTRLLAALGLILFFFIFISGFSLRTLLFGGGGAVAFLLTLLIFNGGAVGQSIAVLEPFFLGLLYYKLLTFSRASEAMARASSGLTQLILILVVCAFLLHGMVLYLSAFHAATARRSRKEALLFLALAIPVVLFLTLILPSDFVSHAIVFNRINPDVKPQPIPLEERGYGWEGGNLRSERFWEEGFQGGSSEGTEQGGEEGGFGQEGQEEPASGGQNSLEGVPADQWGNLRQGQGGENKQYAVMVVASPVDPVYAADAYFDHFDPARGFLYGEEEPLNELSYLRFLETWKDPETLNDRLRYPVDLFYLSTLPERFLAYRPYAIEPTVLKRTFHPFDYSYRSVSRISRSRPREWRAVMGLSPSEREALHRYLAIPLQEPALSLFRGHLEQALAGRSGYYERIEAILKSFTAYQYELGFDDNVHVSKLENFLGQSKRGDCTEFSNTAAILARLAGIPSRVVTGYLAARELQTLAHLQGLQVLRENIEPLRELPLRDLYLVTTAHRHSWAQFYLPGYGWVDFETTAYALPPVGGGDPNSMDVVIPLIQEGPPVEPRFRFPWILALQVFLALGVGLVAFIYLYRYGNEIYLRFLARGSNRKALAALYKLLLINLAGNGYRIKPPAQTPLEYAEQYPELAHFAALYTRLRFREGAPPVEREQMWADLRSSYRQAAGQCRKAGLWNGLRRAFSLRGLYYRW